MQIKENLNSNNSLRGPTNQIYPLLFYGLHVCYAGVISKVSMYCSNGKYQGMGKYMFTKTVCFSKMPRQTSHMPLHSNFIFINIEHKILGIMHFFF